MANLSRLFSVKIGRQTTAAQYGVFGVGLILAPGAAFFGKNSITNPQPSRILPISTGSIPALMMPFQTAYPAIIFWRFRRISLKVRHRIRWLSAISQPLTAKL
jgi:hypothetical protein